MVIFKKHRDLFRNSFIFHAVIYFYAIIGNSYKKPMIFIKIDWYKYGICLVYVVFDQYLLESGVWLWQNLTKICIKYAIVIFLLLEQRYHAVHNLIIYLMKI